MLKKASSLFLRDRPVSNETCLIQNRKVINKYIQRIGRQANLDLSLDSHGFCYIPFKKFLIIIQVPEDQASILYFYTMIFDLHSSQHNKKVQKRVAALQLADLSLGKRGSTLSLDGDEVNLSFSVPIQGLKFSEMLDCLEDFMETAMDTNYKLCAVR